MKSVLIATMAALALSASACGASASVLYSNGAAAPPYDASSDLIFASGSAADPFTLSGDAIINGVSFVSWANPPGVPTLGVNFRILNDKPSLQTKVFAAGTAATTFGPVISTLSDLGIGVREYQFSIGAVALTAGAYWLELSGASSVAYWDASGGPSGETSGANFSGFKSKGHTFQVLGDAAGSPSRAVPEPETWALMLIGFMSAGAVLRRGRRKVALSL